MGQGANIPQCGGLGHTSNQIRVHNWHTITTVGETSAALLCREGSGPPVPSPPSQGGAGMLHFQAFAGVPSHTPCVPISGLPSMLTLIALILISSAAWFPSLGLHPSDDGWGQTRWEPGWLQTDVVALFPAHAHPHNPKMVHKCKLHPPRLGVSTVSSQSHGGKMNDLRNLRLSSSLWTFTVPLSLIRVTAGGPP